jgi:hypothetical protein
MGVLQGLSMKISEAETMAELEPLVAAFETLALKLERENDELKVQVIELQAKIQGQESRG